MRRNPVVTPAAGASTAMVVLGMLQFLRLRVRLLSLGTVRTVWGHWLKQDKPCMGSILSSETLLEKGVCTCLKMRHSVPKGLSRSQAIFWAHASNVLSELIQWTNRVGEACLFPVLAWRHKWVLCKALIEKRKHKRTKPPEPRKVKLC